MRARLHRAYGHGLTDTEHTCDTSVESVAKKAQEASADEGQRKCIVFTGPSGLRSREALQRLVDYAGRPPRNRHVSIVKLEDSLVPQHLASFPDDPNRGLMEQPGGLQYLLFNPQAYLEQLWTRGAGEELSKVAEAEGDVFVLLHTVLYHTESREFFSWVDADVIGTWAANSGVTISAVVTLIDDIYDALSWLTQPGALWHPLSRRTPTESSVAVMDHLYTCLQWRSMELFSSSRLAKAFKVPHYVLAVKHHISVAYDLVLSEKAPIYVSHPISAPRELLRAGDKVPYERLVGEVGLLTEALNQSKLLVPIYPTAIDELRLDRSDLRDRESVLPRLIERWPFPHPSHTLHVPPAQSAANLLDPDGALDSDQAEEFADLLRPLVQSLARQMQKQIASRDRKFVEEAKGLAVWRPYFNGRLASGVALEIQHRNNLVRYGILNEGDVPCFVSAPKEDLGRYRIELLIDRLAADIVDSGGNRLPAEGVDSIRSAADIEAFAEGRVIGEELQKAVDPELKYRFTSLSSGRSTMGGELEPAQRAAVIQKWNEVTAGVCGANELSEYLREYDHVNTYPVAPTEYVQWIEARIRETHNA